MQDRQIKGITDAINRIMCLVRGSSLTEEEFNEIAEHLYMLNVEMVIRVPQEVVQKNKRFMESYKKLQEIRSK